MQLSAVEPVPRSSEVGHLRTDGVHRRESAGTGPAVLEVARVTSAAYSDNPMDVPMIERPCFPTPIAATVVP